MARNTAEDASVTYFITEKIFCQYCGMQLRTTPAERECKEKFNKNGEEKEIRPWDCIEAHSAAWLNIIFPIILWG
ncbi:MAG TPA: hypothetical protein VFS97_10075 [Nitrososphaeraceae archaeon]|nr:hypothetical protein [Nitrososphaeraceae archaeon]